MREYKFRGKRVDNGEWVFGSYTHCHDGEGHRSIIPFGANYHVHIDPETVGQYTLLTDKNGKEIYEGDIIEFEDMGEEGYEYKEGYDFTNRAVIVFKNGRYTLDEFMDTNSGVVEELDDHEETYSVIQHGKVIGNRWDNPDLLGEVRE